MDASPDRDDAAVQAELDELQWYHSIDVRPGVATKGWFDLRHALPLLPFPDLRGKRCLDVGTWDGFYAYEMERRGASEVVALDIEDLAELDYPPEVRADPAFDPSHRGSQPRFAGFHLLHDLLDSKVQWRAGNIYDLDPADIGTFDFVVVGSLLIHLRDPIRALDAVRSVTSGSFLSADYVHPSVNLLARRDRPLFQLRGVGSDFQWWLASDAGLRQALHVGGFAIDRVSDWFVLRPGERGGLNPTDRGIKGRVKHRVMQALAGDGTPGGHLHRAYLCHPRF